MKLFSFFYFEENTGQKTAKWIRFINSKGVIFAGNWDKYDNWPLNSASKIKYYNYYSL